MLKKILLGILIVPLGLAAVVYNAMYQPLVQVPKIGRGLPSNFEAADQEFQRRVLDRFPLPMATTELVAKLRRQGIEIDHGSRLARFSRSGFPCNLNWRVSWVDEDGQVVAIAGEFGAVCV
ncbi:MAG: hypothetical protein ABJN26_18660 [Stappiaceae bacterium]